MKSIFSAVTIRIGRLMSVIPVALLVACATVGLTQSNPHLLQGHVPAVVSKGKVARIGLVPADQHLHLTLQLPLRNQSDLKSFLSRLYDSSSPDYHKYLSVEEFTAKYGPSAEDYQKVVNFAGAHGMSVLKTPRNRMLVEVDATTAQVNAAFHVAMTQYQHPTEKRTFFAADREPSVTEDVSLQHISGLNNLDPPHPRLTMNTKPRANDSSSTYPPLPTGSGPYQSFIPSDFRAAYYGDGALDGSGQTIGLFEYMGYDQVDLDNFYSTIGQQETIPINVVFLGGLTALMPSNGNDAEAILDITYAMSMTPKLDQVRVYECCSSDYSGSESGAVVILNSIASENIAKQISCSYGWGPELAAEDPIYQEMAAQGQTFFAATSDYGSPLNPGNDIFDDYYPADDAWVTAVSMSLVTTSGPDGPWASEVYAGGAGGGYSDGPTPVPLPSYQAGIANDANQASTQYRNMPDVVINGGGAFLCGGGGTLHQCYPNASCTTCDNGGSSMSAPIWASYMALANQEATNEGKPAIGFLNPELYSIAEGPNYTNDFHDIIGGSNNCCGQTYAYNAVTGYDLVSGWGTPNGANLINDLVSQSAAFSLLVSSNTVSIGPGDSASTTVSVGSSSGFSGNVSLSVSGLPSGVTASFDTNPVTVSSNLTLTSGGTPAAGTYTVIVAGTSGNLSASTTLTLTVTSTQGNFTVGSTLTATAIQDGTSVGPTSNNANVVTITSIDNFAGTVNLSLNNAPAGVTASFVPASVTLGSGESATSVMTLTASATTPTGAATAVIAGSSGTLSSSVPLLLSITPAFTVGTSSTTLAVVQGQSATIPVYVSSQNGFNSPVTLMLGGLPSGVTASFNPQTVTPPANGSVSSTLTLTASASAPIAASSTSIVATSGAASTSEAVTVAVTTQPPAFGITSPLAFGLNVGQNGYISVPIDVASQLAGFNAEVSLSISGLPSGLTATFSPATINPADTSGSATSTLTVTADASQPVGTFGIATITGTSGSITNTLQLYYDISGTLTTDTPVVASGSSLDLTYSVDPGLQTSSNWIGIVPHGSSPQTPNPLIQQTIAQASGTLSINAGNLASGTYDAWTYFEGGNTTLAGPVSFTVGTAPSFSLTAAPTLVNMGGSTTAIAVTVTSQNGFSSAVTLTVTGLPSGVFAAIAPGTVTLNADCSAAAVITLTPHSAVSENRKIPAPWAPAAAVLALLFMPLTGRFVRNRRKVMGFLILCVGFLGLLVGTTSCTSTKQTVAPATPSTVTVTGTSGSLTSTTTFTLYVQ